MNADEAANLQAQLVQLQADLAAQQAAHAALQAEHQHLQQQQLLQQAPAPGDPPAVNVDNAAVAEPGNAAVYRVAAKLPPFWPDSPSVWFAQVEAQFSTAHITADQTKYDYVISQLESKYAFKVRDILTNPPAAHKYDRLKAELIRRMSPSDDTRVRQLLETAQLGDKRPSEFLTHMRCLAETTEIQDPLLRTLWLRQMPAHIQAILQTQARTPLEDLAALADRIMEVAPPAPFSAQVHAIQTPPWDSIQRRLDELFKEIITLKAPKSANNAKSRAPPRAQFRGRSRTRNNDATRAATADRSASTPPTPARDQDITCWYHRRYGADAQKCTLPCSMGNSSDSS